MDKSEVSPVLKVLITLDRKGRIVIAADGPIQGKDGLVVLLEEAAKVARQAQG